MDLVSPMKRPEPRGPLSEQVLAALAGSGAPVTAPEVAEPLTDDDLQITLLVLNELHYRGIEGVDDGLEWDPALHALKVGLDRQLEAALREAAAGIVARYGTGADEVMPALEDLTAPTGRPRLAGHLASKATLEQFREHLITRSIYHLKEADPHTWAIPRLSGDAKAAMVEIQADEYGTGRPEWVHSTLFARTMEEFGLETRYGHYVDHVPAVVLAGVNTMSLFGLHRRLRGAVVGHLAMFEMTSTIPNRLYAQGVRRLGYSDDAAAYFDEHVEADAVHEQIALRDLAGGLVRQEPELAADVLLGAAAGAAVDELASSHMLRAWKSNRSALRPVEPTDRVRLAG